MIISHKYKFIFVKTFKTAGTSIEVYLSQHCGGEDIVTPIFPHVEPHTPRNHTGFFNPIPELTLTRGSGMRGLLHDFRRRRKFYNHIPAWVVRARIPEKIWKNYFKFCVERNPWDKTLSHYSMAKSRFGDSLPFDEYLSRRHFPICYPLYTDLKTGKIIVDRVVRYENLLGELGDIFGQLGIPFDGSLHVKAKSEYREDRRSIQEVYTEEQKHIIQEAFSWEIRTHGYQF